MHSDTNLRCRVCGYKSENPPWGDNEKTPLYDYCPCCGVEHGYQDSSPEGARNYRTNWIATGAKWMASTARPKAWEIKEQLNHIPPDFI